MHNQTYNKEPKGTLLRLVHQSIPSKNIKVLHPIQMSGVNLSSRRVEEIVLWEECIPGIDKVNWDTFKSDLKVTIQAKEPPEGTVDGVVEGNSIKTVVASQSGEELNVV